MNDIKNMINSMRPPCPVVKEIPNHKKRFICDKHGEQEYQYYPYIKGYLESETCAVCKKEAEDDEAEKEAQRIKEWKEERVNDWRIGCGISPRNAGLTFDSFIAKTASQEKAKEICQNYIEVAKSGGDQGGLMMLGSVGTGKTLLACAMIEGMGFKSKCKIIKVIDLVRRLKETWSKDCKFTERDVIGFYSEIDLLILDEVGVQFDSDMEKIFLFDIIDGRYQNMKPTVIISNRDIEGVKLSLGERCVDRLRDGGGDMIAFDWASERK